jgi:signal transduction histidine kinase
MFSAVMSEQASASAPARVLVVDDEPGVRESLRAILHGEYEVLTASSGDQALALVAQGSIDIMTLDLKMPGMDGVSVLQRVKQMDPDIEVLIITGNGSLDSAVEGLRLRAFDYLTKPFDCERVRRLVQMAHARRAAMRRMKTVPEQLLSSLSHELRTPLNVILGYSSMLREERREDLSEEQRLALDRIQANSTSLLAYVETIFYMAELDRGLVPLEVTAVNVGDLFARLQAELGPRALEKGLRWRAEAPAQLMLVTDADKLARLVRALVDNAVRFTLAGEVDVVARPAAGGVRLEIHDTGPGLGADLITEVEEAMAGRGQTRPPRLLGFGLRLATRVARTLGAVMTIVASETGTSCQLLVPDLAAATRVTHESAATA